MAFRASRSVLDRASSSAAMADNLSFAAPKKQPARSSIFEVVGHGGHDGALAEQQPALEEQGALVVQQLAPPRSDDEFGHDDRDHVVVIARVDLVDETQDRPRQ